MNDGMLILNADGGSTRDRLIATARRVFATRGYEGASIREITASAGTNLGAVTYHFGSKQALYEAVLEEALAPMLARVTAPSPAGTGETALDGIERVARAAFAHLQGNPDLQYLVLQQLATRQEMPATAARVFGSTFGALAERIREGQTRGEIRAGDPVLLAISVASQPAYFGLVARYMLHRMPLPAGAPGWDAIVDHAIGFIRAGLAPGEDEG